MPDSFKMKWDINWLYFLMLMIIISQGYNNYVQAKQIDTLERVAVHLYKQSEFQMGVATSQNYVNVKLVNKVFDSNITVPDINVTTVFEKYHAIKDNNDS